MSNSINSLSPNFRDFLLGRNIITDTIKNNGLEALLVGIGYPVDASVQPVSIQSSNDISIDGETYQESNLIINKYKGTELDHRKVNIIYNPTNYKNFESYLDKNGKLKSGGAATQVLNVIGDVTGLDAATTLINRTLVNIGIESDSQLGILGAKYLNQSLFNNIAFNIKDETFGKVNLNPLSLAKGDSIILPSNNITVPSGKNTKPVDLLERMIGFKTPFSLLTTSIFTFDEKSFIGVSNIDRANSMIANTGKGQVLALFANMQTNTNPRLIGKRNGYTPGYTDSTISKGENTEGGTNGNIYAYSTPNGGGVIDLLNSNTPNSPNYPVANSNHNLSESINNSGFNESPNEGVHEYGEDGSKVDKYIWGDKKNNKPGDRIFTTDKFTEKKSLLYKTQEMFKSNNIRTLTSGRAVVNGEKSEIQSAVRGTGFISKGSGVLSETTLLGRTTIDENLDEESVFCRTWTTFDRYNQIFDLQKHSGLNPKGRPNPKQDVLESVLEDTGLVKIGPYKTDKYPDDIKRYMFSIENLAWNDALTKLLPSEKGPGDLLTGRKGRIMWFPPYNISFNESVSVSWDKTDFIGRGEPIYTYNNTERTGSLSWQIVVDHPNYMNYFPSEWGDDEIAAFFAGCLEMEEIRDSILTDDEKDKMEVAENTQSTETVDNTSIPDLNISFYFANDNTTFPLDGYENGLKKLLPFITFESNVKINYVETPTGKPYGLGVTNDEKIVSSKQTTTIDTTNFGLNGWKNPKLSEINGILTKPPLLPIEGLYDENFATSLTKYFKNECKYCKIHITGFASKHTNEGKDKSTNTKANNKLSDKRAASIKLWFKDNVLVGDSLGEERFKVKGDGVDVAGDCGGTTGQESIGCKSSRRADVIIKYDSSLKPPITTASKEDPVSNSQILRAPISRFFTEGHYFEKMEQDDKFAYDTIKEKIKHFHPGFHSMTPEGFNSRLNFLHQCTRQGATTNSDGNPDNLAFGRPPVCILRLGDFYHTKIIIDSLTIDYDPLVWDLNPEGVGVQPMIANVTISFSFIGGSSLKGPINRLQNAVSFNFYANTEIYDPRSEKIKLIVPKESGVGGEIVPGEFPDTPADAKGTLGNTFKTVNDQEAEAKAEAEAQALADALADAQALAAAQENDEKILSGIKINGYTIPKDTLYPFIISLTIDPEADTKFALTKEYVGKLFIVGSKTNAVTNIGDITLRPNTIGDESGDSILISTNKSQTIIEGSGSLVLDIEVYNEQTLIAKGKKAEILINNKLVQDFQAEYYTLTLKWTDEFKSNKTYSE